MSHLFEQAAHPRQVVSVAGLVEAVTALAGEKDGEYVAAEMLRTREMFVPLSHRPGHAQADFGEADGYIGGKKVRLHYYCMDLHTRTAVSSRRIRPKRRKLFAMAMWRHSISSAACRNRFCCPPRVHLLYAG